MQEITGIFVACQTFTERFRRQVFGALVHSVFVYDDYLKIIFNVDSAGAAVVPYEAAQAATPSEAPPGSYLDTLGAPKRYLARSCGVFFIAVFRGGNARAEGQALKGEGLRSAV